jgi:aromatic ring-opening dioxygenase catalytic subunit (LigB family)
MLQSMSTSSSRLPVVFVPHGGGPWPFVPVRFGTQAEQDSLAAYLRGIGQLATPPRALLVISAHWEEPEPTVMTGEAPPLLFDYYGFPAAAYELSWPAPGAPALAARVVELLAAAGMPSRSNAERGFDHGTFVPLMLAYPEAQLPTVQLSLKASLDPREHLQMGRALSPLRDEGVLIIGSGMTYHNMRGMGPQGHAAASAFDAWLRAAVTSAASERDELLSRWHTAPAARSAHPREEHLLPLMVIAGAAGDDLGRVAYRGTLLGLEFSGYSFP